MEMTSLEAGILQDIKSKMLSNQVTATIIALAPRWVSEMKIKYEHDKNCTKDLQEVAESELMRDANDIYPHV